MANLKDTIVLGNLTVTGQVVASDILISGAGAGNEFDTIKVNLIQDNGGGEIELEASNDIIFTINSAQPLMITSNSIAPQGSTYLGTYDSPWISTYTTYLNTSSIGSIDNVSALTLGSGTHAVEVNASSFGPSPSNEVDLGSQAYPWKTGYFDSINAFTQVSTPSIQNSGSITLSCGGSIELSATSAGGGYIDLNAKYSIRTNNTIVPIVTTANLGSTSTPFNKVYGKNFYASSDARLKENIVKSYFDYYNIINKIQLVNYTWKSDEQHILHHGLIAQQLKEILPEELHNHLISESTDDEKMMSVNDGKLVYFALGALQQQLQINNKLEQRIQKLEELIRGDQ